MGMRARVSYSPLIAFQEQLDAMAPEDDLAAGLDEDAVRRRLEPHAEALRRLGVTELSVFGSVARGEADRDSDVDVLVTFDGPTTSESYFGVKFLLEEALGARIDLVTAAGLKERIREAVLAEAVRVA